MFSEYLWIVIVGGLFMFLAAMGIGANDVANAFSTSIGSKALTMKGAVIIATIFEFSGALLMGSHVTETIRKDIANYECFEHRPVILMYGCMYVLLSVGIWLFLASKYEMPVSTTHSCVGGMIGMAMAAGGANCVIWYKPKDQFPYVGGVIGIVLSWLFSPILSMILSMIIYGITRVAILRQKDSFKRSFYSFPIYVGLTLILNAFFIIYKGGKGLGWSKIEPWLAAVIALSIGIGVGLIMIPIMPVLKKYIIKKIKKREEEQLQESINSQELKNLKEINNKLKNIQVGDIEINIVKNDSQLSLKSLESVKSDNSSTQSIKKDETKKKKKKQTAFDKTFNYIDEIDINKNKLVKDIHDHAEKFDKKTEESFKFLQIFTAICDSFSHGANDVANSVGPFAAIYAIWKSGAVLEDSSLGDDFYWILTIGGIGISLGLIAYGYKIIRAIGVKMCKITPSRGFSIELGSATIIILGSRLGIPLSTTHCQVGATIGVGLLEKKHKKIEKTENTTKKKCNFQCYGVNLKILIKTLVGWVITLVIVGATSAALVTQGIYGPSILRFSDNNTHSYGNISI
tara:strand:+ start:230 stop:1945 length:1716 start_codon:yes stop_codon:yes gene_type:complete